MKDPIRIVGSEVGSTSITKTRVRMFAVIRDIPQSFVCCLNQRVLLGMCPEIPSVKCLDILSGFRHPANWNQTAQASWRSTAGCCSACAQRR